MVGLEHYQMLIDGEFVDAENGDTFESLNPATGVPWATIPAATENDVNRAVTAADRAFSEGPWSKTTPTERGRYLCKLGDILARHSEELGHTESVDTGKMAKETKWQAAYIADFFHFYGGLADKITGHTLPIDKPDMNVFTHREPLGVVAAVVPWNSQMFLVAIKIGPALAAGNTVVLKASEHASAAMLQFGKMVEEAGFPPGVINIITGFGEPCGRILTSHPLVARISFTGGPETARHIIQNSTQNLAEISLELGGKSPVMVFEDAHIESAANGVIASIFGATGQSCVAGSRLYVHTDVADEMIERITQTAKTIKIGDPLAEDTQMGPLATLGQLNIIEREVAFAQEQGAKLVCGGKRPEHLKAGWFYEPTILECPSQSLKIVDTELFGPVLSVLRFTDEAEVVACANDSKYGLAAGIFTRDVARAHRVARAVRAGIVWINTYRVVSPIAEFGGFKNSGYGRESGADAIYDYTRPKTVWIKTSDEPMGNPFIMQ